MDVGLGYRRMVVARYNSGGWRLCSAPSREPVVPARLQFSQTVWRVRPLRPRLPADVAPRPASLARLDDGPRRPMILPAGLAGYGKTANPCDWAARRSIPVACLAQAGQGDAPRSFVAHAIAIDHAAFSAGRRTPSLLTLRDLDAPVVMLRIDECRPLIAVHLRAAWQGWSGRMATNGQHRDHAI